MTDLTTAAAEHLSQGVDGSDEFVGQVAEWSNSIDAVNLTGLLPIAIAMLILHEMYYSTSENRAPRLGWMLIRIAGFGACLAGYDRIVGLLTGLVGGGEWPDAGDLIAPLDYALGVQLGTLDHISFSNFGEVGMQFLIWAILFAIDCMMGMLAFVIVTVIMKGQALALIIFISAGKTCLILSIMPGVGIAKSWAKLVATVAAWSFMAKIVFSAVGIVNPALGNYAASTVISGHMQIWLTYGVLAVFTAMIPKLVSSLVSGGMSAAPGLGMAIAGGVMGAKFLSPSVPSIRGRSLGAREKSGDFSDKTTSRPGSKFPRGPSSTAGENSGGASHTNSSAARKTSRGNGDFAKSIPNNDNKTERATSREGRENHQGVGAQRASRGEDETEQSAPVTLGKSAQTTPRAGSEVTLGQSRNIKAQPNRSIASSGSNIDGPDINNKKTAGASSGSQLPRPMRKIGSGGTPKEQHPSQNLSGVATEQNTSNEPFNRPSSAPGFDNGQNKQTNSHKNSKSAQTNHGKNKETPPPSTRPSRRTWKQER